MNARIVLVGILVSGCSAQREAEAAWPAPPPYYDGSSRTAGYADTVQAASLEESAPTAALSVSFASADIAPAPAAPPPSQVPQAHTEKLIVEAWMQLQVEAIADAAEKVRKLTKSLGGKVVSDDVQYAEGTGQLVLRVPPDKVDAAFTGFGDIGQMRQRNVRATDVSKQFFDDKVALENLTRELQRYQEILKAAQTVNDMLQIEQQLNRVKAEIERVKGDLTFLSDRVQLATFTINLTQRHDTPHFDPSAKFHPGAGAAYVSLARRGTQARGFAGPTLSVYFLREAHFDLAVLDELEDSGFTANIISASFGADAYSDFLGGGVRQFFNPYVGLTAGVVFLDDRAFADLGADLGLEIFKTDVVMIDARLRTTAWLGHGSPRLALQPGLGINVAF